MKRNLFAILILALAILVTGCSSTYNAVNQSPEDQETLSLDYEIEQVVLTKGYQNTEPKVELIQKNNETRLVVYPGLLKSAGVQVEEITMDGGKISISLVNQDNPNSELVIPQITVHLTDVDMSRAAGAAFSIVNKNYTPIRVNYGIVDVLNKLKADMKISSSTSPQVRLVEDGEKLLWEVVYENIFDRDSKEVPLINLKAVVDSGSGQLVMSSKSLISSLVAEGKVLSFDQDHGMIYTNDLTGNSGSFTSSLWLYDTTWGEKYFLYGTNNRIESAEFSHNGENIAFIENDGTHSMLYIIQLENMKVIKVSLPGDFTPNKAVWGDGDLLFISETPVFGRTRIMKYDILNNNLDASYTFELPIINLTISKDTFAVAERDGENTNRRLHISYGGGPFQLIGMGWNLISLDKDRIGYLEQDQKVNSNALVVYDAKQGKESYRIQRNFSAISYVGDDKLLLVERVNGGNDFSLSIFDVKDGSEVTLGRSQSEKVYLNMDSGVLLVDLLIPFKSEMSEIIYAIKLENLK